MTPLLLRPDGKGVSALVRDEFPPPVRWDPYRGGPGPKPGRPACPRGLAQIAVKRGDGPPGDRRNLPELREVT